jgi:hypothetical protein
MARDTHKEDPQLHDENAEKESEKRREDMIPPDTSKKQDGVTSGFSSSTGKPGKYSGEDTTETGGTGPDDDKIGNS